MRWIRVVSLAFAAASLFGPLAVGAQSPPAQQLPPRSGRMFNGISEDHILQEIRSARITGRRQVGSTSVNFHLTLASDVEAAYKPRAQGHSEDYRAEIAAYRLNRLLGLNRVPPAISRVVPRTQLHLRPDTRVIVERDGNVRGAAIYWVPVLRDSMIDREREIERWSRWLRQGNQVPPDQSVRAEEISTLIVFDYLTGNYDRWSGQNVPMDSAGHLVYRDNNGGFVEPFGDGMHQNVMRWLRRVQRFSRGVIERARALTPAAVRAEMALDPDTAHPPLTDAQIASLMRRRDTLVAYVDALVQRYGAANVMPWP